VGTNMKTLNLNKLILLTGLFIVSIIFSAGADASCRYNSGLLDVKSGNQQYQVYETSAGQYVDACTDTPDEYEITFYKLGICTATTAANDLSSCQYIVNNTAGVTHVIEAGTSGAMAIPEFSIDPGTYTHMVVVISNKLGVKHSFSAAKWNADNTALTPVSLTGASSSAGTTCWTSVAGPSAYTNEEHAIWSGGSTIADGVQLITCGAVADSAPVFSYEIINILSEDNCLDGIGDSNYGANGDYSNFGTVGNGTAAVSLLKSTDVFATACTDAAKILWTTTLTTPYVVTSESTWKLNMKTTDSVSVDFSNAAGDNKIMKMGADPVQLYLTVTD
jgi:hypothetical protein